MLRLFIFLSIPDQLCCTSSPFQRKCFVCDLLHRYGFGIFVVASHVTIYSMNKRGVGSGFVHCIDICKLLFLKVHLGKSCEYHKFTSQTIKFKLGCRRTHSRPVGTRIRRVYNIIILFVSFLSKRPTAPGLAMLSELGEEVVKLFRNCFGDLVFVLRELGHTQTHRAGIA